MPKRDVVKVSEAQVSRAVMEWLAAKHIFAIRINSGTRIGSYKGKNWAIHMAAPGTADILAFVTRGVDPHGTWCSYIQPTWLEIKGPKGVQSELQKSFQAQVEAEGHVYAVIRSVDELEALLR